ncbi:MAG: cation-translocating P-type ATPase [Desulfobulbaceae bacterium]|nr:MAG: cation-translocating P-type ATPase [Desulfobulbaceae bacterium]
MLTETKAEFSIKGMTCADCAETLERRLKEQHGIKEASVSFALAKVALKYNPELLDPTTVKRVISSGGYTVEDDGRSAEGNIGTAFAVKHLEAIRVVAVGLLLALGWILTKLLPAPGMLVDAMMPLAIIVGGYPIAANAIRALFQKKLNVDLLVIIAAAAAVAIGDYLEAGLVIFILLLGEFLETITVARTGQAIKGLASLIPNIVKLKRDNQEIEVPPAAIKVDDTIVVRPGEHIAIDGIVVKGEATIDQALITGESIPVEKLTGDEVYAGTINKMGAIEVKATKVGRDTTVAKIERMITESLAKKAPVERTVDRFAGYFVPAVLVFAALVYLITLDIRRAITVLIVACPCALVLGTPTAVVAAIGSAARRGILIKGGEALEAAGRITGFIFDKTGTLTWGKPRVLSIKRVGTCAHGEDGVIELAAAAEKFSEHPLASAILEKAREHEVVIMAPDDFKMRIGSGVEVRQNGLHIMVGNREMLKDNDLELSRELHDYIDTKEQQGATILIVVHGREQCSNATDMQDDGATCCPKEVCGVLELVDPPRKESAQAIELLRAAGAKIIALYTGDNPRTAATVAGLVGIDEVIAMLSPADKANKINDLKARGKIIAMVGDGINDAPALAAADLGIAMGVIGSDITVQAANVVILDDDILSVPRVTALGRKALAVIRQNIAFAVVFNTLMMGLAAYGIIGMVVAAIFHQVSSLVVIFNSMRLLRWKKSF